MIVDPDFLEHWRTRMVVDALGGDEYAPLYMIRIWGHCQMRKSDRFDMPASGLKAVCKFRGEADTLESALIAAGFLERDGLTIIALKWSEKNASLIAAWENGAKGGRPSKSQNRNPEEPHGKPMGIPAVTHGEPSGNPPRTHGEPIREEGSREEKKTKKPNASPDAPASPAVIQIPLNNGTEFPVTQAHVDEFATLYPAVDVMAQLRKMRGWCVSTPQKRKTKSGVMKFINAWLSKEQDSGKVSVTKAAPAPGSAEDYFLRAD